MLRIFQVLGLALLDLFHPRMLLLLLLPPLVSLFTWTGLGWAFWDRFIQISRMLSGRFLFTSEFPPWIVDWFSVTPDSVATVLAVVVAFLLLIPLVILTSLLITSVVVMPAVLAFMGRSFPDLEKRGSGILIGSAQNLVKASVIYGGLWVLSLPLWMIPGLGVAIPLLLNGYLNYRLFAYDSLGDYASPRELKVLLYRKRLDFLILGVIISALLLVPPLFFILPIYSGLCFARFSLLELQDFRQRV